MSNNDATKEKGRESGEIRPELPDYLRPGLEVVFVGFNPGDLSSRLGHYYAWPQNQFWSLLHESGLLPEKLGPEQDYRILEFGLGLTDIVKRWSTSASELRITDYRNGIPRLRSKLLEAAPGVVAFNGKGVYEKFCGHPIRLGWQREPFGKSRVFVLPSTSPLNARLARATKLRYFRQLASYMKREAVAAIGDRPAAVTTPPLQGNGSYGRISLFERKLCPGFPRLMIG
jgi:TDG/mug DNA glycosylase family protein